MANNKHTNGVSTPSMKERLRNHHNTLLELCEKLELIADALPDQLDKKTPKAVLERLATEIAKAHEFEEQTLFPALQASLSDDDEIQPNFERLRFEHWEDESFADEVCECLREYLVEPDKNRAETLSYMLRGFFEGMRRHVAYEQDHLVPLMNKRVA